MSWESEVVADHGYLHVGKSGRLLVGRWRRFWPGGLPEQVWVTAGRGQLVLRAPDPLGGAMEGVALAVHQHDGPVPRVYLGRPVRPALVLAGFVAPCWVSVTTDVLRLVLRPMRSGR